MAGKDQSGQGPSGAVDVAGFNAFESAGWEHQASTYDHFFGRITRRLVGPLVDAAAVGPGSYVLDVATGPGYAAAEAAERGASVMGVDVAPTMVRLASNLHPGVLFREGDAEALPFNDGSFDAVISNFVVPHLGRPEHAMGELVRVLKIGGTLAVTTWDLPDRMRLLGVVLDAIAAAGAAAPASIPVGPPFFRFADDEQFTRLLHGSGLSDVSVTTIAFDHDVATTDQLWDGVLSGTVRTSALVLRQPESTRLLIRSALDQQIQPYQRGNGFRLPISVKLARGCKAA